MQCSSLSDDPLNQLAVWRDAARDAGEPMPGAMCVATASSAAVPSARMVLLRGLDTGLVFFTDYSSAKGADLEANPRAAVLFHWYLPVHRQVRVTGAVARTSDEESDRYWESRPPASRRSAVVSDQSAVLTSRSELERRVADLGDAVPDRPARWGGYRVTPEVVELWEEGPDRLHDRIRYRRVEGGWQMDRLSP